MEAEAEQQGACEPGELSGVAKSLRWAELLGLYFGLPAALAALIDPYGIVRPWAERLGFGMFYQLSFPAARLLMPTLVVTTLLIVLVLVLDRTFTKRQLWNAGAFIRDLPRVLLVFFIGAPLALGIAWALDVFTSMMDVRVRGGDAISAFLYLPREQPIILVLIAIGYPWFSAYPQEITHRAFFFHRYEPILPDTRALFVVNVLAFVWLHAPFWHPIALAMTLPGGILFAWTYLRTRSTLAAGMEHALWGWWVFFTGLGYFVFAGGIGTGAE